MAIVTRTKFANRRSTENRYPGATVRSFTEPGTWNTSSLIATALERFLGEEVRGSFASRVTVALT